VYALNGLAKGTGKYADIEPIWKLELGGHGNRVDIGGLISAANTYCGNVWPP
jgi:hypothetical protein